MVPASSTHRLGRLRGVRVSLRLLLLIVAFFAVVFATIGARQKADRLDFAARRQAVQGRLDLLEQCRQTYEELGYDPGGLEFAELRKQISKIEKQLEEMDGK